MAAAYGGKGSTALWDKGWDEGSTFSDERHGGPSKKAHPGAPYRCPPMVPPLSCQLYGTTSMEPPYGVLASSSWCSSSLELYAEGAHRALLCLAFLRQRPHRDHH